MGLETPTYVDDFVITNPASTDLQSQGDDHLRNIKSALKNTFPNATQPFYRPTATNKSADFSVASTDLHKTFFIDTSIPSTSLNVTLPSLTTSNDGWFCSFVKTSSNAVPVMINPASGTLQSGELAGLSRCRRAVTGIPSRAVWSGAAWIIERVPHVPIGTVLDFSMGILPAGFEWANGQTLSTSLLYPELFLINGSSLVLQDRGGRLAIGRETMGGVAAAGRVTTAGSGITGTSLGAVGGAQNITLVASQIPALTPTVTVTDPGHAHTYQSAPNTGSEGGAAGSATRNLNSSVLASTAVTGITVSATIPNAAQTTVNKMPPGIVTNMIIVVE